jgi:uncharacterized protein YyaL (SSP411 family)
MKSILLRLGILVGVAVVALLLIWLTRRNDFLRPSLFPNWIRGGASSHESRASERIPGEPNRLAKATSPYLRQHADNPVDWYPWGEEAFAKARKENKPIFLSVGYSTCHWCHVMEHESFENPYVAGFMNNHFVNIKVDREERPDVDRIYMTFVQATTGGGGWPMSVWLTPDLKPFVGGTYFPPEDAYGRPGFLTVLKRISEGWQKNEKEIRAQAGQITEQLQRYAAGSQRGDGKLSADALKKGYEQLAASYDSRQGGFGGAPKFPQPSILTFLFDYAASHGFESKEGKHALEMACDTLRRMASGGIHDHLGGGFHRYSVDAEWHVPHFEKMLYDQAQLAVAYLTAYQITRDLFYADIARDILDYVRRDMTSREGGFFSAEDADSLLEHDRPEHAEGAFYVWTASEIESTLGKDRSAEFNSVYGVEPGGNTSTYNDPHGELRGKNVLMQRHNMAETAKKFGIRENELNQRLAESRKKLLAARSKRPRPHLDDKILTAWNGLMISAFAKAYQILGDSSYLEAANRAADCMKKNLYNSKQGVLLRSWRDGSASDIQGFADDYAFLIQGLVDLYEASFDIRRFAWAEALQQKQNALFWDNQQDGFFNTTGNDPNLLFKIKENYDGAEPSPNSVSALNLLRLAYVLDRKDWRQMAEKILRAHADPLSQAPRSLPQMLVALDFLLTPTRQVVIAGSPGAADTMALLREVRHQFLPNTVVLLADGGDGQAFLAEHAAFFKAIVRFDGKATAYVCENYVCQQPTSNAAVLARQLVKIPPRKEK